MSKKKIAVIENHALATTTIRSDLMKAILAEGHELFVLTGESEIFQRLKKEGYNMINVGQSVQNPLSIFSYLLNLRTELKKINPDVVLTFTIRPAIYGNIITRFLNIPTVTNVTGIGPLFENDGLAYKIARTLYPFALKKTRKVFFQNFDDMNLFWEKGFAKKEASERIPGSGINYKNYIPRPPKKERNGEFAFCFISRLLKDKGVFEYIDAARIMKQKYPNSVFNIIGPFWNQNTKANTITEENIAEWEDEGIIKYLGEAKDVREFIPEMDSIVLPSYREGTSNILLESASMEKPLVATNVTGCKEIIDDGVTGYLCKVRDHVDLAEKMEKMYLLSEEQRIEMGKKGREKVIREYDKQIVIDAYMRAIQEIIQSKKVLA